MPKPVYDGTTWIENKPADPLPGLIRARVLLEQDGFLDPRPARNTKDADKDKLHIWADSIAPGQIGIIDIECWFSGTLPARDSVCEASARYIRAANIVKGRNPAALIGCYGAPPIRNYWECVTSSATAKSNWTTRNDAMMAIAHHVDVICPSLYTFYHSTQRPSAEYERYIKGNIEEARRLGGGKPVIPFLWFQYHDSNTSWKFKTIEYDFWLKHLQLCDNYADGSIIWGGRKVTGVMAGYDWDETAPWWKATQDFVSGKV
jgi:hypothetical protein